ncbi:hypothetical protein CQW23_12684 [Capsicum baccatum]|uniref:Uncharacterized protein n=1 Tax=Capsicum baccatum TaxID=33114 RepID=A0A2G2WT87_CAPBA|nr:hypothetical protein CQW23_12684 [Capsicum baccatum]
MFFPCTQAAILLVEYGSNIYCIDRAFAKFGMAMGPLRSDTSEDYFLTKYYHRNNLALVSRVMELTSENNYGTVSRYVESDTVDPSIKMGNMLPGSEGSAEIFQVVDNQNYKEGGNFENSNLIANIMETRSPFMETKDNESVDLGPSTISSKGIVLEEQSVEIYVNCYS